VIIIIINKQAICDISAVICIYAIQVDPYLSRKYGRCNRYYSAARCFSPFFKSDAASSCISLHKECLAALDIVADTAADAIAAAAGRNYIIAASIVGKGLVTSIPISPCQCCIPYIKEIFHPCFGDVTHIYGGGIGITYGSKLQGTHCNGRLIAGIYCSFGSQGSFGRRYK